MNFAPCPKTLLPTTVVCSALLVLAVAFGFRHIESHDLGYHLAYGEHWWRHFAPVDHDAFVYASLPAGAERPEPGPGCWYDESGRHRFPNANWLSQAITWAVFRLGGETGVTLLVAALLAATTLVQFLGMRGAGVATPAAAAATLYLLCVLNWRVDPRPELFGYLVLSWLCTTLLRISSTGCAPAWRDAAGLAAAQVLLVNLHSYFLLGLALTGCFWLRALLSRPPGARRAFSVLVLVQALACFANPWTWRLAMLPIQTVLYLSEHGVSDPSHTPPHPWSAIDEFRPLPLPWQEAPMDLALALFHALLLAAALAFVASIRARRLDHAAVLVLGALAALSMRRNVPPAALLLVPAIACARLPWATRLGKRWPRALAAASRFGPAAIAGLAAGCAALVAGGVFHPLVGSRAQFGGGLSPLFMPTGVARWLDTHRPAGRLWTDFNASSNLHFFTRSRPEVPLLTNTWAQPPAVMHRVLDLLAGAPFEVAPAPGVEVVALETDSTAAPMVRKLAQDRAWTLVHVEPRYVVFLRTNGANAALAAAQRQREDGFDQGALLQPFAPWPALSGRARRAAIRTFDLLGWRDAQIAAIEALLADEPRDAQLWAESGTLRARRGVAHGRAGDAAAARADLEAAQRALQTALGLQPDSASARQNLGVVQEALARLRGQ